MVSEYYVAPWGSDYNPGSFEFPFKSIQAAVDTTAGKGRTIYLREGVYDVSEGSYRTEQGAAGIHIEGWKGGLPDAPLAIAAYRDEQPVLDSTQVAPGQVGVFLKDVENVDIVGLEIHSAKSHGLEVVNGKNIDIVDNISHSNQGSGIGVRGYMADAEGSGDTEKRSEDVRIEGNYVFRNMLDNSGDHKGETVWGGALFVRHAADVSILDNHVYENYGEGLIVVQTTDANVDLNTAYDNFSVNVYLDNASKSNVANNLIYTTDNEEFFRMDETGHACPASNIGIANEDYNNIENPELYYQDENTIRNNVLINGSHGLFYGTYAGLHSHSLESKKGFKNSRIVHNTLYNPEHSFLKIDGDLETENVEVSNNIFFEPEGDGLMTDIDGNHGFTFNHNLWHGSGQFGGSAGSEGVFTATDVTENPQLVAPGSTRLEDYQLLPGSAAVDAAGEVSGMSSLDGAGDIGAFELDVSDRQVPAIDDRFLLDLRTVDLDGDGEVDEQVGLSLSDVRSDGVYENTVGFYTVEDESGAVFDLETDRLIGPGETGYARAALERRLENILLRRHSVDAIKRAAGGQILAPYIISNGTVDEVLAQSRWTERGAEGSPKAYFAFTEANLDGAVHVGGSANRLWFEDLWGGGDRDFADFAVSVDVVAFG